MDRELRRFPRIAAQHAVLVKRTSDDGEEIVATRSLGAGGLGFLSDAPLGVGSVAEVLISVRHEVIKTKAKVIYEIAEEGGKCEVGLQFIDLSESDRERIEQLFDRDE